MQCLHNALIRTHHITSRKKVAKLKQAATFHEVYVLLRYGGAPGVMYVEGKADGVNQWVSDVQVSCMILLCTMFLSIGSNGSPRT